MAHSPRGWTGARTPSAIKRVRQTERRRAINQPRRTAARTLVSKALVVASEAAGNGTSTEEIQQAVQRAVSALDRAAKIGAIHRNAADRRKSRLMLKVNAAIGGESVTVAGKAGRTTGKAAAAKQAKARIAASRATKAKGAQTAAGKARAALARTSRDSSSAAEAAAAEAESAPAARSSTAKAASKAAAKPRATTARSTRAAAAKPATKSSAAESTAKSPAKPRASKKS